MRADPKLERIVRSWLQEEGHEDAERVLFTALDLVDTTPQRRAGWLARTAPIFNNKSVRYGIAAVAVVVVAAWRKVRALRAGAQVQHARDEATPHDEDREDEEDDRNRGHRVIPTSGVRDGADAGGYGGHGVKSSGERRHLRSDMTTAMTTSTAIVPQPKSAVYQPGSPP